MTSTRMEKLERIVQLNTQMNQIYDHFEFLNFILKETEAIFDVLGTSILLEDEEEEQLKFYVMSGEKKDTLKYITMDYGEGVCGHVFNTGYPLIENEPEDSFVFSDKADKITKFKTKNLLAVPIKLNNKMLGVLELVNKNEGDFTEEDVELLEKIAAQIAIVFERARHMENTLKAQRLTTIGETVADLAHCIKNIITGLSGGVMLIDNHIEEIEHKKIRTGWQVLKPNIDRISKLTSEMVEFSKERKLDFEKTDIHKLIRDVFYLVQFRFRDQNIVFEDEMDPQLTEAEIDSDAVFRSLLNLVSNALDAVENDKGIITIRTHQLDSNRIEIIIQDNGCGIADEYKDKLFVKFFSTKGTKGTGLGLALVKKIIDAHNGIVSCSSRIRKGTSFIIRLPIVQPRDLNPPTQ